MHKYVVCVMNWMCISLSFVDFFFQVQKFLTSSPILCYSYFLLFSPICPSQCKIRSFPFFKKNVTIYMLEFEFLFFFLIHNSVPLDWKFRSHVYRCETCRDSPIYVEPKSFISFILFEKGFVQSHESYNTT